MTALPKKELLRLIQGDTPLVSGFLDLDAQVQPNGIDLTLKEVFTLEEEGVIARDNADRRLTPLSEIPFDKGRLHLAPGSYLITYNEIVNLPRDVMALGRARSSLLRCGAAIHTAVWDAGYSGRSQSLLVVYHPAGITLEADARLMQLVFFRLSDTTEAYNGIYQNENK
ncbi:deoxyuridine 5'-triphosphate nucleotidohydrolase [Dehalogenimonas lykanthroporepellens BL-DC-9]|jgi:dUTP pyrophosphatase|nr:deoxyuridine 5'-triphosphate nucleotidohydrolase [Dehalogenimonas lykanthroporepellens BL-DC-9]